MGSEMCIRDSRGAVGSADPQALAAAITHHTVGIRPGRSGRRRSLDHNSAVHLLGTMHTHPRREITGQFVRTTTMPAAREESMFKTSLLQVIGLQVIAAITTDPAPTLQSVESAIRSIEWIVAQVGMCPVQGTHGSG